MTSSSPWTLPPSVKPEKYLLTLEPNLDDFTFQGEETIEVRVLEPTSEVQFNCVEIEILWCSLTTAAGDSLEPNETTFDTSRETVTFSFDSQLVVGPAKLHIRFTGELNDKLRGFYRSRYIDPEGRERYLATTQFEATDARRAFPCWDEPAVKSTFELTLVIPSDMVAVSNMPAESETETRPGATTVRYPETPIMSTYLLAFVVGDLKAVERQADDGTLVRVWATRGNEEKGRFALDTSVRLLAYFQDYFGIPYPLPKLDHVAIPDFAAGAMENWGAITYREIALLIDPDHSSAAARQRVASIVSHEMAHMWFGDLVTMAWWNDLWLNESFASWMGDKAVDSLFPEWHVWTQFVSADTNRGLSLDGLRSSHPIEQEVANPAEIGQLFDAISYSKGASILRMLEHFLGAEAFRHGLHGYLDSHAYSNARTRDLWDALAAASGQPVAEIMDTWVMQTGYPLVDVQVERGPEAAEVSLSQSRFLYEHILGRQQDGDALWAAPVQATTGPGGDGFSVLMDGRQARASVSHAGSSDPWIKVNPQQTGFYRVRYSPDEMARLRAPVESGELPPVDRLGLQNDAFALARAGHIPATQFLTIAEAYKGETDSSVCGDLAINLSGIETLLGDEPYYARFQAFGRSVFGPIGERVGWDARPGEGDLDALLRSTVLSQLGAYEDEASLREATARFARYVDDPASVDPNIRLAVFSLAASAGDHSTYDTIWGLYRDATLEEEKVRLLRAMAAFRQDDLLERTLERSLSDEVRAHDTIALVATVAGNRRGRQAAWEFVKANWTEFDRRYGEGGFGLMQLVAVPSGFTTGEGREDAERFFTEHPVPSADRTVRQTLERIEINIAWLERNRADLERWFVG